MKKEDDIFYVEIQDSENLRRSVLESNKGMIELLQHYEKLKQIRREKKEHIGRLAKNVKEINKHVIQLKKLVPESKLKLLAQMRIPVAVQKKSTKPKATITLKSAAPQPKKTPEMKKASTQLDKLQAELGMIEDKLRTLQR